MCMHVFLPARVDLPRSPGPVMASLLQAGERKLAHTLDAVHGQLEQAETQAPRSGTAGKPLRTRAERCRRQGIAFPRKSTTARPTRRWASLVAGPPAVDGVVEGRPFNVE